MSYAEQTAYRLYDTMHLGTIEDDVRRCLVVLLTAPGEEGIKFRTPHIPADYEEAMSLGAEDVEVVREDLHRYVGELAKEFNLK